MIPLQFRSGIDNRSMEADLRPGFARDIVNLDVQNNDLATRAGRTKWLDGAAVHSLWSNDLLDYALYVDGDTLYKLDPSGITDPVITGLQRRDMHYVLIGGKVYFSNGIDTGTVNQWGVYRPWGVETPSPSFAVAATASGGMDPGTYQVTMTYFLDGEESGAPEPIFVEVGAGGGIAITSVPQPRGVVTPDSIRVYVSAPGDSRLFHNRDLPIGMTSVNITAANRGRPLDTLLLDPMGAGVHLRAKNGRIFSAAGKLLRWTEPLRHGLTNRSRCYYKLPDSITGIASPDTAGLQLYVGTAKKTYVFAGDDIDKASFVAAMHTGIIPGSIVQVPADALGIDGVIYPVPVWIGTNGLFYAGSNAGIIPLNKKAVTNVYGKVAATFMDRDSSRRYVAAGIGGKTSGLAITDRMVARVVDLEL
jgi:hypothetical protein